MQKNINYSVKTNFIYASHGKNIYLKIVVSDTSELASAFASQ